MQNLMLKAAAWKQARPLEVRDEEGQTVVEYALVVGLVSVVIIAALAISAGGWITKVTTLVDGKIPA